MDIPIISDQGEIVTQKVPKSVLIAIIKPRVEEIFELVEERLSQIKLKPNKINKIILCGGGANLNNIRELASKFFCINC